jgi:hypothetical protein
MQRAVDGKGQHQVTRMSSSNVRLADNFSQQATCFTRIRWPACDVHAVSQSEGVCCCHGSLPEQCDLLPSHNARGCIAACVRKILKCPAEGSADSDKHAVCIGLTHGLCIDLLHDPTCWHQTPLCMP